MGLLSLQIAPLKRVTYAGNGMAVGAFSVKEVA